ncbi:MAG: DNA cytosine methyltransferase [Mucilaginibacter sp.]
MELTHGSLFTGRGGFEAAAEDLNIKTIWNCELDPWLRGKLKKLYPDTKQYGNVKYVKNPTPPHILTAGFPCQDISIANSTPKGIHGSKSGLWFETARVIKETMPPYVILENSAQLLKRGFEYVLRDLSGLGYNVEWQCLRACDFGYPHQRKRVYIIAYTGAHGWRNGTVFQPIKTIKLHREWTPTAPYLLVSDGRATKYANFTTIPRNDVVQNFRREIQAYGNAVMPVIAEYLFQCIIIHANHAPHHRTRL